MCYNKDNKQDEEVINMRNPLIITIGREYGSGGREIGELVAKTLGIAYYDKKLITLAAQKSGLSDEFIANNEQRVRSGFMQNLAASAAYSSGFFSSQYLPLSESIFISEAQVIRDIAAKESAVIVGRSADYILAARGARQPHHGAPQPERGGGAQGHQHIRQGARQPLFPLHGSEMGQGAELRRLHQLRADGH